MDKSNKTVSVSDSVSASSGDSFGLNVCKDASILLRVSSGIVPVSKVGLKFDPYVWDETDWENFRYYYIIERFFQEDMESEDAWDQYKYATAVMVRSYGIGFTEFFPDVASQNLTFDLDEFSHVDQRMLEFVDAKESEYFVQYVNSYRAQEKQKFERRQLRRSLREMLRRQKRKAYKALQRRVFGPMVRPVVRAVKWTAAQAKRFAFACSIPSMHRKDTKLTHVSNREATRIMRLDSVFDETEFPYTHKAYVVAYNVEQAMFLDVAQAVFAYPTAQGGTDYPTRLQAEADELKPKFARELRERAQRQIAAIRAETRRRDEPKALREKKILAQRDKRSPVVQSGGVIPVLAGVAVGFALKGVFSLLGKADKLMDKANGVFKAFVNARDALRRHLGPLLWTIPLVLTVYFAINNLKLFGNPIVLVIVSSLAAVVGPKLWAGISKFFPDGNAQSQSGMLEMAPKLLSTCMVFSVFKGKFKGDKISEFGKRIGSIDRMSSGWETFLRWLMDAIEGVVNYVRRCSGKEACSMFKGIHKPTYEWAKRVDACACVEATGVKPPTPERLDEMVDLVRTGYGFKDAYRGTPMCKFVDEYVVKISNILQPYLGALQARNNFRFEPLACLMLGDPGIGKTIVAVPFVISVLLESGLMPRDSTFDQCMENVFQKGTSEFWNGYAGQLVLMLDDGMQGRVDPTDKDNEYINLIRMVGSWSFPLNFADLNSKGKIFFGSKFIFGTTNLESLKAEAGLVLNKPEAVIRRISSPYKMYLKEEYFKGQYLDQDKYKAELVRCQTNEKPIDRFPWYMWEVARHDFSDGKTSVQRESLKDLVLSISADLRKRTETFGDTKEFLKSFVSGYSDVAKTPSPEAEEIRPAEQAGVKIDRKEYLPKGHERNIPYMDYTFTQSDPADGVTLEAKWKEFNYNYMAHRDDMKSMTNWINNIAIIGSFVFMAIAVKSILGCLWGMIKGVVGKICNLGSKPEQQSNRNATLKPKTQAMNANDIRLQSADSTVCSIVYANTYKTMVQLPSGDMHVLGQSTFLRDNLVVQPLHFTTDVKRMLFENEITSDCVIRFISAINKEHTWTMTVGAYLLDTTFRCVVANADVEFYRAAGVRAHRDIVNNYIRESDIAYLGGKRGRLDICDSASAALGSKPLLRTVYTFPTMKVGSNLYMPARKMDRYICYDAPTVAGDCGAPLCIFDAASFSGRTAIGFHVAGIEARRMGYSTFITQEMIERACKDLDVIKDEFEKDLENRGVKFQAGNVLPFEKWGSFLPLGEVEKAVPICPKTSLYVTKDYGAIGEYACQPAPLSPVHRNGVLVYPMANAVEAYSSPVVLYEQPWLKQAVHTALRPLSLLTKDASRRVYTFEEAVLGIPAEKFRSIPRGTAAGFPYVYDVRDGKKEFFGSKPDYDLTLPLCVQLKDRSMYILDKAREGVRLAHVFLDFLKDELRSEAKVRDVATRLISSAPLDYTVAWRMMFGAFCAAFMRHHTLTGMAPGICTYTEWDLFAKQVTKMGPKAFAGDFKKFDAGQQPIIMELLLDFINKWYDDGPENAMIRRVLWMDMVHSRHLGGLGFDQRHIYQWNKSLPSGHPFTTIINSMYSLVLLVGVYISITGDLTGYWSNVSAVTYGDDNVNNPADNIAEIYNQVTVADAMMREFGYVYTSDIKDGELSPYTNINGVTFLKRGCFLENGFWRCPLELDSFLYTFYWCKNRKLEEKICIDVLENALLELSMHDQDVWDEYAHKLYGLLESKGVIPQALCERDQYQNVIRTRGDAWY